MTVTIASALSTFSLSRSSRDLASPCIIFADGKRAARSSQTSPSLSIIETETFKERRYSAR